MPCSSQLTSLPTPEGSFQKVHLNTPPQCEASLFSGKASTPLPSPGGSDGKESACNAGDPGSIPGPGGYPGGGNGNPLQDSCLGNPMDRGAWWATVHESHRELDTTEQLALPLPSQVPRVLWSSPWGLFSDLQTHLFPPTAGLCPCPEVASVGSLPLPTASPQPLCLSNCSHVRPAPASCFQNLP